MADRRVKSMEGVPCTVTSGISIAASLLLSRDGDDDDVSLFDMLLSTID